MKNRSLSLRSLWLAGLVVLAPALLSVFAMAQDAPPSDDTFVSNSTPTKNFGALPIMKLIDPLNWLEPFLAMLLMRYSWVELLKP